MAILKDFKAFIMKGDIIALATAVVIGRSFQQDRRLLCSRYHYAHYWPSHQRHRFFPKFIALDGEHYESLDAAREAEAAVLTYGNLIQAIIYFLIVAAFIFLLLRAYEKTKTKKEAPKVAAPKGPSQEELLVEIRDELRKQNSTP